jgi:hypothetical protein
MRFIKKHRRKGLDDVRLGNDARLVNFSSFVLSRAPFDKQLFLSRESLEEFFQLFGKFLQRKKFFLCNRGLAICGSNNRVDNYFVLSGVNSVRSGLMAGVPGASRPEVPPKPFRQTA